MAAGMQAEWFDVTRPAETYARVLARLGIDAAESVGRTAATAANAQST
jgi:hypothetical protein